MRVRGTTVIQTCEAYPEQYDVLNEKIELIGYIRIRWGYIVAWCPDECGEEVFSEKVGRMKKWQIHKAVSAVVRWHEKTGVISGESLEGRYN